MGKIRFTLSTEPNTPPTGKAFIYMDEADNHFKLKDDTGNVIDFTAGLVNYYLGTYTSLLALETTHPTAIAGAYADVDTGVGSDAKRYAYDVDDVKWIEQLGESTILTDVQIKNQYENNPNTNAFDDDAVELLSDLKLPLHGIIANGVSDILTINTDTTKFDIKPFDYYINGTKYSYAGTTGFDAGFTLGEDFVIVYVDSNGIGLMPKDSFITPTQAQSRLEVGGMATADGSNIIRVGNSYFKLDEFIRNLYVWSKFGKTTNFLGTAGAISESITDRNINIASGSIIDPDLNKEDITGATNIGMVSSYHVSGEWTLQPKVTPFVVDNLQYDDGTDIATLGNNKWACHTIARSSRTGTVYFIYSQGEFSSEAEAIDSPYSLGEFGVDLGNEVEPLAKVIIQKSATNINQIIDIRNQTSSVVSASTSTMQTTYDRSSQPQIVLADGNHITYRNSIGDTNNTLQEWKSNDGLTKYVEITKNGLSLNGTDLTTILNSKVNKAGDTITGDLEINGGSLDIIGFGTDKVLNFKDGAFVADIGYKNNQGVLDIKNWGDISLTTDGGERVRIKSDGKVAINGDVRFKQSGEVQPLITSNTTSTIISSDFLGTTGSSKLELQTAENTDVPTTKVTILGDGNVGIGTTSPSTSSKLTVSGTAGVNAVGILLEDTASTTNYSLYTAGNKFNMFNTNLATDVLTVDGNDLGIGVTAPQNKLSLGQTDFIGWQDGGNTIRAKMNVSATTDDLGIYVGANPTTPMAVFTNDGKVGIGTTTPSTDDVDAKVVVDGRLSQVANDANLNFKLKNTGSGGRIWQLLTSSNGTGVIGNGFFAIRDETANKQRLVISDNGNIGIGTSSFSGVGSKRFEIKADNATETTNFLLNTVDSGYFGMYQAGDSNSYLYRTQGQELRVGRADANTANFNYDMVINGDGKTLIGTATELPNTTVDHKFQVSGFVAHNGGWSDMIVPFAYGGTGGSAPTETTDPDGFRTLSFSANDEVTTYHHVNHNYMPDTDAFPHIHWLPTTAMSAGETVVWECKYKLAKGHDQNDSFFGNVVTFTITYTAGGARVAGNHVVSECSDIQAFGLLEPDTMVGLKFKRLSGTYSGAVYAYFADIHHKSDREVTLNKAPDFNA